jgi:hypothetical protein
MAMAVRSIAHALKRKLENFMFYMENGFFGVGSLLFIGHPVLLLCVLFSFNVEGDLFNNLALLCIWLLDCVVVFLCSVWMDAKREGKT